MLWKCDLDTNTNSRADAKHVWKENNCEEYMAQHKKGDTGIQDGTVNSTVYTMTKTSWRTLKSED